MKMLVFDMPDEPQQLTQWLEQHLAGLELNHLVAELTAVHGEPSGEMTLENACGSSLSGIIENGLNNAPVVVIQNLLTHPRLLLELQTRISFDDGAYWPHVPIDAAQQATVDRGREHLRNSLLAGDDDLEISGGSRSEGRGDKKQGLSIPHSEQSSIWSSGSLLRRRSAQWWILITCGLMMAVGLGSFLLRQPVGWSDPARLTADRSPSKIFASLAEATDSYINAPRNTPEQLKSEIGRFIRDCQHVQEFNVPSLAAIAHPDRELPESSIATYADWLNVKCKDWEGKAQTLLDALRDGSINGDVANQQYTLILTKLKAALTKQSAALA